MHPSARKSRPFFAARGARGVEWLLSAALVAPPPAPGQERPGPTAVFPSGTATVVLDVVVRDKKGRPVDDVRPEEIEVYEDGVPQKIEGFRRVEAEPPAIEGAPASPPAERPDSSRHLNLVTIVFDQLGAEGRRLAQKAAQSFLDRALRSNVWVSVFRIDRRLALLQPFTADAARLKEAVAQATSGTSAGLIDERAALERAAAELERLQAAGPSATEGQAPDTNSAGGGFAARAQARALASMLRLSDTLQRQQVGETSLYPLLGLVKGHQTLAGRKTLLYVSEGLQVPPNLDAVFRSTISEANRANVSVYAVDVRGLDTARALEAAGGTLDQARRISERVMRSRGAGAVEKDEVMLSETAESALRLSVEGTMAELAESTGGFLIANTNDFRPGTEKIAADLRAYYELTYVPPVSEFDGRFRRIEVRVARKDVAVQARSGYFALPTGESAALFAYEAPLLGALGLGQAPHDFELRGAALRFGAAGTGRDHKLVVEVPIGGLRIDTDEERKTYRLHFSLLALVKDEGGRVLERFSEDYPFEGPLEKVEGLRLGNIVFKRGLVLPPGRYVLEAAGQDRATGRLSVQRSPFEVPPAGEGPRVSSLSLIRRVEQVTPGTKTDDPLDFQGLRIVPNLDAPISAALNAQLSFFLVVYPSPAAEPPRMTVEFLREGKPLGRAAPPLPAPDADGLIRYVGTFPTSSFGPGRYEVKVAVQQAGARCEERGAFRIVP